MRQSIRTLLQHSRPSAKAPSMRSSSSRAFPAPEVARLPATHLELLAGEVDGGGVPPELVHPSIIEVGQVEGEGAMADVGVPLDVLERCPQLVVFQAVAQHARLTIALEDQRVPLHSRVRTLRIGSCFDSHQL